MISLIAMLVLGGDDLLADFEGRDYGAWKTTGTAFGSAPAPGTLPRQMHVEGFLGKGLVNSFLGGDGATGTLTSPPFTITRPWIGFLIGGGSHAGETCINLLVGDAVVRTSTGRDEERLEGDGWDVAEFKGKTARIEIVDRHTGGWGHINVDQIVQSDRSLSSGPQGRDLVIEGRYLHLPVRTKAPKRRMKLLLEGRVLREFEIELAEGAPDFWAFIDVAAWKGKTLRLEVRAPGEALAAVSQGDEIRGDVPVHQEARRPVYHFTSRRGWLNDPNGMVFHKGEWHLYYQHNPYGWDWGNMHWGHAVSRDLVRWEELPLALHPARFGDWAFSGSAVVDAANTSGFKRGAEDVLVAAYTSTGRGECIVSSDDRGRTWREYEGNPVLKHAGRDPRLLWHAPTKRWIMAVYDEDGKKQRIAFHSSPDLKTWTFESRIDGYYECPDFFELPVDGDASKSRWVLYGADGKYALGSFDGKVFTPEGAKRAVWHGNFYAAQTFSDVPDGRRIQIGWGQGVTFPGMPFNQQMTVPVELTLRTTEDGPRMFAWPVKELASLHGETRAWRGLEVNPGGNPLAGVEAECVDLRASFPAPAAGQVRLGVRGVPVIYDAVKGELSCRGKTAPLQPVAGRLTLRVLSDRGSLEIFGNEGRVALSVGVILPPDDRTLSFSVTEGALRPVSLELNELKAR